MMFGWKLIRADEAEALKSRADNLRELLDHVAGQRNAAYAKIARMEAPLRAANERRKNAATPA